MRVPVRDTHDSLLRGKPRARTGNSIYFKFVGCSPRLAPPSCRAINRRRHLGKGAQIVACVLNAPLEHTHTQEKGKGRGAEGVFRYEFLFTTRFGAPKWSPAAFLLCTWRQIAMPMELTKTRNRIQFLFTFHVNKAKLLTMC